LKFHTDNFTSAAIVVLVLVSLVFLGRSLAGLNFAVIENCKMRKGPQYRAVLGVPYVGEGSENRPFWIFLPVPPWPSGLKQARRVSFQRPFSYYITYTQAGLEEAGKEKKNFLSLLVKSLKENYFNLLNFVTT
jgi:hypothetical protein